MLTRIGIYIFLSLDFDVCFFIILKYYIKPTPKFSDLKQNQMV